MADTKTEKKSTNPLVFVGVGCLVLIVVVGLLFSIAMRFFAKRIGVGMLQNAIEQKTGVKTNLNDLSQGKLTMTDSKTGTQINVGTGTIPDAFPKDFPIYPGAKVTSSLSGAQAGKNNGFWLTLSTTDAFNAVDSFYKNKLSENGWTAEMSAMYTQNTTSETVTKGSWSGSLTITADAKSKETQIVILLGQESVSPTAEPTSGASQ